MRGHSKLCILASLALSACGPRDIPYALGAQERPYANIPTLPGEIFIPNAAKVLPPVLVACGVRDFEQMRSDQGEFALAFDLPPPKERELARCIETHAPKGAVLHRVFTL